MALKFKVLILDQLLDQTALLFFTVILMVLQGPAASGDQGYLSLTQESYVGSTEVDQIEQSYQNVSGRFRGEANTGPWNFGLSAGGGTSVKVSDATWFFVSEAWVQRSALDRNPLVPADFSLGRKRQAWSKLDEDWNLGLWEPLFRWDALRPEKQGLTGLFVTWKMSHGRVTIFTSLLSLPEQGPRFKIADGQLVSSNPWFVEPTDKLILFSQETRVRYQVEMPELEKIVLQPSVGLLLAAGDRDNGIWASAGYINKPRNTLALPFDASLQLSPVTGGEAVVVVYPRVQRHQLASLDAGYGAKRIGFFLSTLVELPDHKPSSDQLLTYQILEPQYLVAPGVEGRLLPSSLLDPRVLVSLLHQEGGHVRELGPYSSSRMSVFAPRLPFAEGLLTTLKVTLIHGYRQSLEASIRWLEELRQHGTLLMTEVRYRPTRDWTILAGIDVLGTRAEEKDKSGLINRFRGNDRIFAGVSYVF